MPHMRRVQQEYSRAVPYRTCHEYRMPANTKAPASSDPVAAAQPASTSYGCGVEQRAQGTYKRRHGPHDAAHPCVGYTVSLHGCVDRCVEDEVEEGEAGREGVDEGVEEQGAGAGHHGGEGGRVQGGEVAAHQHAVLCAVHLAVEGNLHDLVDGVGSGAGHGGA